MSKDIIKKPYLTWTDVSISLSFNRAFPWIDQLYKYHYKDLNRLLEYSKQND